MFSIYALLYLFLWNWISITSFPCNETRSMLSASPVALNGSSSRTAPKLFRLESSCISSCHANRTSLLIPAAAAASANEKMSFAIAPRICSFNVERYSFTLSGPDVLHRTGRVLTSMETVLSVRRSFLPLYMVAKTASLLRVYAERRKPKAAVTAIFSVILCFSQNARSSSGDTSSSAFISP